MAKQIDYRVQIGCLVAFELCGALYAVGLLVVARLILPAPSPAAPAAEIAAQFTANAEGIRTGALLMVVAVGCFAPFGALLAARTRRMEGDLPVFTMLQVITFGATLLASFLVPFCFALASFRQWHDPEIVQLLNDGAWFLLLYIWPLFTVWLWSVGLPVLLAEPGTETLPRWTGPLSMWCGALFATSLLVGHIKTGSLAYDGLLGLYVPAVALAVWGIGMSAACLTRARAERTPVGQPA